MKRGKFLIQAPLLLECVEFFFQRTHSGLGNVANMLSTIAAKPKLVT